MYRQDVVLMLSQPKKKKKGKTRDKRVSNKVRVLARPNQPLGASFDYDFSVQAMFVTEFVSEESVLLASGVKVGMFLTEVDDLKVVGLKQDDVVFMLKRKAESIRELLFEAIQINKHPYSSSTTDGSATLRTKSAENGGGLCLRSPTVPSTVGNDISYSLPHQRQLPDVKSPSSSNTPLLLSNKLPVKPSPSESERLPTHGGNSADLHKSVNFSAKMSTPAVLNAPRNASVSKYGGDRGKSLRPDHDPFSTPARRRRLVADIARFLLKQYCVQACSLVHTGRVRIKSAIIIQCLHRRFVAGRKLQSLRFQRYTAAATRIQAFMRMILARRILKDLLAKHRLKIATDLALCLQCQFRVHRSNRVVATIRHEKTSVAVASQRIIRGRLGRRRANVERRKLENAKNAKHKAAILLQCCHRRQVAERVLLRLRRIYEEETSMSTRIAKQWRRHCQRRQGAAALIQRMERGRQGRRVAASALQIRDKIRREALNREEEMRLMSLEDNRAFLMRAQHRVEIRVDLSPSLLSSLKRCKLSTLVKWCLEQSLLCYDEQECGTYSMGDVIRKVVGATHSDHERASKQGLRQPRHMELQQATEPDNVPKDKTLDIDKSASKNQQIQLPTSNDGYPLSFDSRYIRHPKLKSQDSCNIVHDRLVPCKGRPLTLSITPPQHGNCVCMHLDPVFRYFEVEYARLHRNRLQKGMGAHLDDPLACPILSTCDVYILLGTDDSVNENSLNSGNISAASRSLGDKYVGFGGRENVAKDGSINDGEDDEMIKFRFKDVSVSVSVTTIVNGDDTTECFISSKQKREAERLEKERIEKEKELAKLEETKRLVAEINAQMEEQRRLAKEKENMEMEAKRKAEEAAAAALLNSQKSRPTTATKRIKVSIIDQEAQERERLEKRLAEEARLRQQLEAERIAAERIRSAKLLSIRQNIAAKCIQKAHHSHVDHKQRSAAAIKIQRFANRWRIMRRWWGSVSRILYFATLACIQIQKRFRGQRAREFVILKRLDVCDNSHMKVADYWMNIHILNDYRFALGRSYVSEGKKGFIIGDLNSNDVDDTTDDKSEANANRIDGIDSSASEDEEEISSDEEEDYIINQRLNGHKLSKDDFASMETFVGQLFPGCSTVDVNKFSTSAVNCSSLENLIAACRASGNAPPVSLQGGGQWAAQLMHMLEFLPPPPCCVKPLEVLFCMPSPDMGESREMRLEQVVHGSSITNDSGDSLGDINTLSPRTDIAVDRLSRLHYSKVNVPAIYSMGFPEGSNDIGDKHDN